MEAKKSCQTIQRYLDQKKYSPSQIAILVRAGYQTRAFEEALIKASISYKIIGGMKFYERQEIKDAICYLRCACNNNDDLAFNRIINTPKRAVGTTTINKLYQKVREQDISLFDATLQALQNGELRGKTALNLEALTKQITRWGTQLAEDSLSNITRTILEESGYIKMWQAENTLEAQGRIENIDEFLSSLSEFDNIIDFLEYVSLVEASDDTKNKTDCVSVMTVHGAKGLEFDLVFIPGLEDSIFPSHRSLEERNGLEEERRLLYVAITRAKKELVMSYTKTRFIFGDYQQSAPSRFISELPEAIKPKEIGHEDSFSGSSFSNSGSNYYQKPKLTASYGKNQFVKQKSLGYNLNSGLIAQKSTISKPKSRSDGASELFGKRIFHQKFGYGSVIGIDGDKVKIDFEKTGPKTIMKNFVKIA
jgi:DNA helicase II / ATP-dependent DNA helicase PcrA